MVIVTLPQLRLSATAPSGSSVRVVGVSGDTSHRHLHADVGLDEAAHDLAGAIRRDAATDGKQDRRQPVLRDYDSVVSHAILSAATSSSAIVR
jgi:hypothetical protein